MAVELHIAVPPASLARRGSARAELGDPSGIDDLRAAIALATSAGLGREAAIDHCSLAIYLWLMDGPGPALEVIRAGITFARGSGLAGVERLLGSMLSDYLVDAGEVDAAEEAGLAILRAMEEADDVALIAEQLVILARIAWLRGSMEAALATVQRASTYPNVDRPASRMVNHSTMAGILADAGDHDAARQIAQRRCRLVPSPGQRRIRPSRGHPCGGGHRGSRTRRSVARPRPPAVAIRRASGSVGSIATRRGARQA